MLAKFLLSSDNFRALLEKVIKWRIFLNLNSSDSFDFLNVLSIT